MVNLRKCLAIMLCATVFGSASMTAFAATNSTDSTSLTSSVASASDISVSDSKGEYVNVKVDFTDVFGNKVKGTYKSSKLKPSNIVDADFKFKLCSTTKAGVISKSTVKVRNVNVANSKYTVIKRANDGYYHMGILGGRYEIDITACTANGYKVNRHYTVVTDNHLRDSNALTKSNGVSVFANPLPYPEYYQNFDLGEYYNCYYSQYQSQVKNKDLVTGRRRTDLNTSLFIAIPDGSRPWFSVISNRGTYYIADYNDVYKNGENAKFTAITDDYIFKGRTEPYTIIYKSSDGTQCYILMPKLYVRKAITSIDLKQVVNNYHVCDLDDKSVVGKYNYDESVIGDTSVFTERAKIAYVLQARLESALEERKDGGVYLRNNPINAYNIVNVSRLPVIRGDDFASRDEAIFGNENSFRFSKLSAISGFAVLPVDQVKIYYAKGEDLDKTLPDGQSYKLLGSKSLAEKQESIIEGYKAKLAKYKKILDEKLVYSPEYLEEVKAEMASSDPVEAELGAHEYYVLVESGKWISEATAEMYEKYCESLEKKIENERIAYYSVKVNYKVNGKWYSCFIKNLAVAP